MKLSVIQSMVREGDLSLDALRYLVECKAECEWLDFKENLILETDHQIAGFVRDVLGLKNVGGGYLVIGVRDKTWEPVGLPAPLPYDGKLLRDKVRRGCGLELEVDLVHHELATMNGSVRLALVFVRSSHAKRKRKVPALVKADFAVKDKLGLRRGEIYVRRGDSTVKIDSAEELQNLLEQIEQDTDSEDLEGQKASPFAIDEGTYRLLEKGFHAFVGRNDLRKHILSAITRDPRIWIVNLHGPGGVGKSALATWATYELYNERNFEAIIQLTAKETVLTDAGISQYLGRSLYSLETLLDHILETFEEPTPESLEDRRLVAIELLSAWKTLLVLDNMETVSDGRILSFVQELPAETRAKVLLTSRQRTGGWELSIPVAELNEDEVFDFLRIKSRELSVDFPLDAKSIATVHSISGGLPLAIQWMIGQYRVVKSMDKLVTFVARKDSPVLEFSFRNIWNVLSNEAKTVLAGMTIFDEPAATDQLAVITEWAPERIDHALSELQDVTLVTRYVQPSDGRVTYSALPITLAFARHQLDSMGEFELRAKRRYRQFKEQMSVNGSEGRRFAGIVRKYGLGSENEKRAAVLCRRGESELFAGNIGDAESLFRQARELAPNSAYVFAMSASHELARKRIGLAEQYADEACRRADRHTGALANKIRAQVLRELGEWGSRAEALRKALQYDGDDVVTRHQYGVALSASGRTEEAIGEFTSIIESERKRPYPSDTLLLSYKTRIINYRRLGRLKEANDDLLTCQKLIAEYTHLQRHAWQLAELDS